MDTSKLTLLTQKEQIESLRELGQTMVNRYMIYKDLYIYKSIEYDALRRRFKVWRYATYIYIGWQIGAHFL